MNRTVLFLAFAVAATAASAQVRVNWNEPSMGTPSVREFVSGQPTPATPASAPAPAPAAQAASACPDGKVLEGRAMRVTLAIKGDAKPTVIDLQYVRCERQDEREQEPPSEPYTFRSYKSAKGDYLGVYSNSDKPTSTLSIHLADGSSSATLIPILKNADLASGRTLDLGEVLFVGLAKGDESGKVVSAVVSIASVPAK